MPRHLVDPKQISAGDYREVIRERNAWLRAHGTNPGDWNQVLAALRASQAAYGIPDSLERTRRRLQVANATEGRPGEGEHPGPGAPHLRAHASPLPPPTQ